MRVDLEGLGPRFRLEAFVARGAWGSVYRGIDVETGAPVAVKRLHEHLCEPTMIARFEREARLLSALDSPHVVRHVAHGKDDQGRPFLVLEWLEGQDLAQWRKGGRATRRLVVEVVRQAALGLAALHDVGIVHRDVKPSNFFLLLEGVDGAQRPRVKLIDLGVARVSGESTLTQTGFSLGTPAYMSPEQAGGRLHPTASSDIFSLGVMLFELIAGNKPYRGDDLVSLAMKIVLQEPPKLRDLVPGVSAELSALAARAMARSPEDRFASARAMADALGRLPVPDEVGAGDTLMERLVISDGGSLGAGAASPSLLLPLGVERRVVTGLFAGFEGTAEPAVAVEAFREAAQRHGGTFHGALGPRRAAVFGASRGRGDEALRAARAALSLASVAGIRLGIVTGRALTGAASLSGGLIDRGLTEVKRSRGEVRVDETTARLLEGRFAVDGARGERVLRAAELAPDAFGPRLLGRAALLVGRDREAAALLATYEQCVAEPVARVVLLTGLPGTGKSRLRYELCRRVAAGATPPTVLHGRGEAHGMGSPFGLLAPAIRRLAGILDGEPIAEQRRKLMERVSKTAFEAARVGHLEAAAVQTWSWQVTSFLGELARVPFGDEAEPTLPASRRSPMVINDGMRAAWVDWIAAECAVRPVLIVLEDLHWGDLPSVTFVDAALLHAHDAPLMVLAGARPEVHERFPRLFDGRDLEELRLGALTRRAAEKLVHHALGKGARDDLVARVVDRAEGNPFYLEEILRALAEGNADELPETVLGMVQARLDALGDEPKRLLRAASVFGRTFWLGGVRALLGEGGEAAPELLAALEANEMVLRSREASLPGETEHSFAHGLVRDAAYAMLADEDRARGHRLAGEWLAAHGARDAAALAEHFALGGAPEEARAWYRRAALQALEANDLAAAVDRAERGATAGAEGELLGALRLIQAEAHRFRGELAQAEARAAEAFALLPPATAPSLRAAAELAAAAGLLGHVDRVEAIARALPQDLPDAGLRSTLLVCLCRAAVPLFWAGHASAASLFARIDALAEHLATLDPEARALVHLSRATRALHAGRPEEQLVQYRAAEAAFEVGGDVRNAVNSRGAVGFAQTELGLFAEAEETLRHALAEGERLGSFHLTARAWNNLGLVLGRLGRLAEAREAEQHAIDDCVAQGDPRLESASRLYLSEILLLAGDVAGASREAIVALRLAATAPGGRARALAALARTALRESRVADALSAAEEAVSLLDAAGQLDGGESKIRLVLAEARLASGDEARARGAARQAAQRVRERADTIGVPAWRESFLAIPENAETLRLEARLPSPSPSAAL